MSPVKILVVEDSPINMELVTDLLEANGYEVLQATAAREGIVLAGQAQPHLILMDIQLPGMDGLTAIRLLKEDPRTSRIPVIALSAHAMVGDQDKAEQAGCDGYITKPIDTRTFPKLVDSFVKTKQPA
ncbi:MAG: response regulator [Candidatus Tectomicrobia bacterium]|uniref:Response regulator n=1 Tax=Tectimicrobiota bacterium TaxID=2528274 RepID=A0A932GRS9_UNCTE|nr:response regulator [Candidatus Tectomicrobia bacterium]